MKYLIVDAIKGVRDAFINSGKSVNKLKWLMNSIPGRIPRKQKKALKKFK